MRSCAKQIALHARSELRIALHARSELRIVLIPIDSETFEQAAIFWASVRKQGKPTSDDKSLDCDAVLAAQALQQFEYYDKVTIITTNVKHIERFAVNNELEVVNWKTTLNNFIDK